MDWEYVRMLGAVGILTLMLQVCVAVWENWRDKTQRSIRPPTSMWQLLAEWALYMVLLLVLSFLLRHTLRLFCSTCG